MKYITSFSYSSVGSLLACPHKTWLPPVAYNLILYVTSSMVAVCELNIRTDTGGCPCYYLVSCSSASSVSIAQPRFVWEIQRAGNQHKNLSVFGYKCSKMTFGRRTFQELNRLILKTVQIQLIIDTM